MEVAASEGKRFEAPAKFRYDVATVLGRQRGDRPGIIARREHRLRLVIEEDPRSS